jgi:hypothetical protein
LGVEEAPGVDVSKKDKEDISSYLVEIYNVQRESIDEYENYLAYEEMQKEDYEAFKKKLWVRMDRHTSVREVFGFLKY